MGWPICVENLAPVQTAGIEHWEGRGAMASGKQRGQRSKRKRTLNVKVTAHHTCNSRDWQQEYRANM
jgi:hypothetical protein